MYEPKLTNTGYGDRQDYEDWELLDVPEIIKIEKRGTVTFLLADNMQYLRWMKDNMKKGYFHVGIVDPPYAIEVGKMNLGATANSKPRDYEMGEWDNAVPTQEYWDLLQYVCRDLIVWGGNYFTKEFNFSGRCFYVWDKKNNGMSFADCELALTTFDKNARIIPKSRALTSDGDGEKRHPTHKPSYLYEYLHLQHELKGKRVLDTHGGSFSHAVAAYKESVHLTIMDKQKSYFESGLLNYETMNKPGRLF
jgi:site-specific DNA-methyltransferase (adenine-specific)